MNFHLKLRRALLGELHADLERPHQFAFERVGFVRAAFADAGNEILILPSEYRPVADEDYVRNPAAGASLGREAIRKALEWADAWHGGLFHIHAHGGRGVPRFSGIDIKGNHSLVPSFFNVASGRPHGAIVLSDNAAIAAIWTTRDSKPSLLTKISIVGAPIQSWWPK